MENIYTREILNEKRKERFLPMFEKIIQNLVDLEDGFPLQYDDRNVRAEFQGKDESEEEYRKELKEYNKENLTGNIQNIIKKISFLAKKENLVMILLKNFLGYLEREYKELSKYGVIFDGERNDDGDEITGSREEFEEYLKRLPQAYSDLPHWLSLPIPDLQDYLRKVSPNELWKNVYNTASSFEKEWQNRQKNWLDITDELKNNSIEEFLKFDGDMSWFNLQKPYCEKEGFSMGHCGNKAAFAYSDKVLSLRETKRQKDGTVLSKPYLTFILIGGEYLGEMKGRANSKPLEKFHPYIMSLLTYQRNGKYMIKGIQGGGYRPENNFDLEDLSDDNLQKLGDERPELIIGEIRKYLDKKEELSPKIKSVLQNSKNKDKILLSFPKEQREYIISQE